MSEEEKKGAVFVAQVYDVRTKKDGGGRIQLDFGADGLEEIQWAQRIASLRGCSFMVSLVPFRPGAQVETIDQETGEIIL